MEINEKSHPILVAIVEDYDLLRQKFANLIRAQPDMECILQTDSIGKFFVEVDLERLPDILLLDIQLGPRNSIQHIHQIRQINPRIKIIIITGYDAPDYILSALKLGINGYFLKDDHSHKLVDVVRTTFRDGVYFSPVVAKVIADAFIKNDPDDKMAIS